MHACMQNSNQLEKQTTKPPPHLPSPTCMQNQLTIKPPPPPQPHTRTPSCPSIHHSNRHEHRHTRHAIVIQREQVIIARDQDAGVVGQGYDVRVRWGRVVVVVVRSGGQGDAALVRVDGICCGGEKDWLLVSDEGRGEGLRREDWRG